MSRDPVHRLRTTTWFVAVTRYSAHTPTNSLSLKQCRLVRLAPQAVPSSHQSVCPVVLRLGVVCSSGFAWFLCRRCRQRTTARVVPSAENFVYTRRDKWATKNPPTAYAVEGFVFYVQLSLFCFATGSILPYLDAEAASDLGGRDGADVRSRS